MNRRRFVYPAAALGLAALVIVTERWLTPPAPKRVEPTPWVPPVLPGESPPTMRAAPKRSEPPIGRPPDVPPKPGEPAMKGTLEIEPTPVPKPDR